ncbi:hypothetical protein [Micromonospora sediminicola]|uniref:hypothetical protein n=1 Tax=Micromonospora sediminicola TaxID=946078 RepID=UPI0037B935AB
MIVAVGINCLLLGVLLIQAFRDDFWLGRLLMLVGAAAAALLTGLVVSTRLLDGEGNRQRRD